MATVDITPDYAAMREHFTRAMLGEARNARLGEAKCIRRVLAPLAIALECCTSVEQVLAFRAEVGKALDSMKDAGGDDE